jgi:hypothetical protein
LSPDGKRGFAWNGEDNFDIYVLPVAGHPARQQCSG